jgi:RimJ/RimL family protein N-acetyltransferase
MLTTARLTLRDLVDERDYRACYAMDCDPLVVRYVGNGLAESRPFVEYHDFMRGRLALWTSERFHMWAMRLHGSDDFLGWAILKPIRDTPHVEVGYRMPQSSWGKGYATEATRAVLAYGFQRAGSRRNHRGDASLQRGVATRTDQVRPQARRHAQLQRRRRDSVLPFATKRLRKTFNVARMLASGFP